MSGDLKRSIAASEEEKHRLNVILQSIPDSLFILDAGGAIALSSLASRKTFGEAALAGRPFIEVVRNTRVSVAHGRGAACPPGPRGRSSG